MRRYGVEVGLRESRRVTGLHVEGLHVLLLLDIGCGQMQVVAAGNVQRVLLFLTVHVVLVVLQTYGVALHIIEREVHIVGIVVEHGAQVCLQRTRQLYVGLQRQVGLQLRLQLGLDVGHQLQLVVHLEAAVREVVIDGRT